MFLVEVCSEVWHSATLDFFLKILFYSFLLYCDKPTPYFYPWFSIEAELMFLSSLCFLLA